MVLGLFIKFIGTIMDLLLPYILSYLIDDIVPQREVNPIIWWGIIMVIVSLLGVTGNVVANRMASRVARNTAEKIRYDLFARTMRLTCAQMDGFTIPSMEARLTTDTYNVHQFLGAFQRLGVRAPILLIGGIIVTFSLDAAMAWVLLATLPLIAAVVYIISKKGVPLYTIQQQKIDKMVRVIREDSQGIRVIKALSKTDYERRRFDDVNREVNAAERKAAITMAASNPLITFFLNLGLVVVILVGAWQVDRGLSEPGKIIAFMSYFTLISNALLAVTRMFVMFSKSSASAKRIEEILSAPADLEIMPDVPEKGTDAHIVFDRVTFSYNKRRNNITDISFSLKKGGTLGIIGATGSGKTTILSLLMRFYDADSGNIYINGRDIRSIPPAELHQMFGVAMQNDFLYAETIAENIAFGREISPEAMERAIQTAQAADFIDKLEDKTLHQLTTAGTNISGGQKQRTLISRALAGNPEILILDDSTSALDYKTDAALRSALRKDFDETTTVVVAQRVSSIQYADLILVLDDGEIIGSGTHQQLMETCKVYREISNSQMGGAILD